MRKRSRGVRGIGMPSPEVGVRRTESGRMRWIELRVWSSEAGRLSAEIGVRRREEGKTRWIELRVWSSEAGRLSAEIGVRRKEEGKMGRIELRVWRSEAGRLSAEIGVRRREEGKKKWMFAFLLVIFTNCLSAQQPAPLTVGDQLPDCTFKQVFNYPRSALNLKQLKGKSIILDFWNTYCGSCISSFAKLDSLQKRYDGRLVIIAVSSQPATVIQQFLNNHPELKSSSIVFAADDQLLKQYFPYKMIPHLVWLDDNWMVKAITDSKSVTTERLDALLAHRPFTTILKKDVLDFKSGEPLLIHNNGSHENYFSYRSIITPFIAGIPSEEALKNDSISKTTHVYVYNATITGLCAFALAPFTWIKEQNIVWEVKDSSRFINPGKALHNETDWDQNNRYCYELIAPLMSRDAVKLQMQIDLLRFFNVFARIEKRDTEEGKDIPYLIIHQN